MPLMLRKACDTGAMLGGVLNSVSILIINMIYMKIAVILNEFENHQTQTQ